MEMRRIKMSEQDALKCFKYLNSKNDGEICYNQFCGLIEERRRNIDPFTLLKNDVTPNKGKNREDERSSSLMNDERAHEEI